MDKQTFRALNNCFINNTKLVQTLQQLYPPIERNMLQLWIDKLTETNSSLEKIVIRNDYMWFILLMLQKKKIRKPFNQLPPSEILPLNEVIVPTGINISKSTVRIRLHETGGKGGFWRWRSDCLGGMAINGKSEC
ncbi:unnamed protein product [Brassicogethes aeneus]|uniref:DUF4485 domain-containing protein n=1 Tax=Brassicogethes aeneus TaxID=1431903 RepID=A0A9P0FH30_BRAAE|nr:unnamed protein product [Brassicogethes aeneus]